MKASKLRRTVGGLLLLLSSVGLILAVGNLLSLPSIERQITEIVPSAQSSVAEAASQSRHKSLAAIAGCHIGLFGGLALLRRHQDR